MIFKQFAIAIALLPACLAWNQRCQAQMVAEPTTPRGALGVDAQEAGDFAGAAELYRQACDLGDGGACALLGSMYARSDQGMERDLDRALAFFKKGCDAGNAVACSAAEQARTLLVAAQQRAEAEEMFEAKPARSRAIEQECADGWALSCVELGNFYRDGDGGFPRDTARAIAAFRKACDAPNDLAVVEGFACNILASLYESGDGVPQDLDRALQLYEKACKAENEGGCSQAKIVRLAIEKSQPLQAAAGMASGGESPLAGRDGDHGTGAAGQQCTQLAAIIDSPAPTIGALASLTHTVAVLKASIAMIDQQCGKPWIVSTDPAAIARQRAELYDAWKKARTGCLQLTAGLPSEEDIASLDDSNPCKEIVRAE